MIICICSLLFNQARLGLFIPQFQTLLSVSRQARTALPNELILMLLCEMCRALNFNLGHSTCCDYVVFSSSIYLEFTFYPFLSSVRSQSAIESNSVDLIKRFSKTFVSLAELHLPAAFSHVHFAIGEQCQHRCIVSNLSRVIANNPGPYNVLPLAASHSVWACVFNCTLHSFSTY